MTPDSPALPIAFGTAGVLQRQTRQLLRAEHLPKDANQRPVAFCPPSAFMGAIPQELDCRGWVYLEPDTDEDPILVLAATERKVGLYLVANLYERAVVSSLASAVADRRVELVVAGTAAATCHQLYFSPSEARYVNELMDEHLELGMAMNPNWLSAFTPAAPRLPSLCQHLNPALAHCESNLVIVLQGTYDSHLRAVRTALSLGLRGLV